MIRGDAATVDELASMSPTEAAALLDLSRAHGVEAWLAAVAPDTSTWAAARAQRSRFIAARMRALGELRSIRLLLTELACPMAVLKGQALSEDIYPQQHLRHAVDIDVLVPPARFEQVVDRLVAARWTLIDLNWPLLRSTMPGQLRLRSPSGSLLDLHWHLLNSPRLRRTFDIPSDDLLARTRIVGNDLPVLAGPDQLVHLALHGALSGANRLVWLADAGLAARAVTDWAEVSDSARRAGAGLALALVLLRAHRYLSTPAPRDALRAAGASPRWLGMCRMIDARSTLRASPDRPAVARSMSRAVRPTSTASVAEFARHGAAWLRGGAPRERGASPLSDPTDPRSPLRADPDAIAREQFFAIVRGDSAHS
jgi:hypothetical protein